MKYDLIEIGVADFNIVAESVLGKCLLFEPHPEHFANLQAIKKDNWTISDLAVSDEVKETSFFYIPNEFAAGMVYPKGQGAINEPNPYMPLREHMKECKVQTISFADLVVKFDVTEIDFLKIDTEGHDYRILVNYFNVVKQNPNLKAKRIQYESNELLSAAAKEFIEDYLKRTGYTISYLDGGANTLAVLNQEWRKSRIVVLVQNCRKHTKKREWIQETWGKHFMSNGIEVFYIEGDHASTRIEGSLVYLNCGDGYNDLAKKVQLAFTEMLKRDDWDYILKTDDDTVLSAKKAKELAGIAIKENIDLIASFWDGGSHMTGAGYLISRRCAEWVSKIELPANWQNNPNGLWSGLFDHLKTKEERLATIPDDYFFSEKICNSRLFKIKPIQHQVIFRGEFNKARPETYLSIHNIKTFEDMAVVHSLVNKEVKQ